MSVYLTISFVLLYAEFLLFAATRSLFMHQKIHEHENSIKQ